MDRFYGPSANTEMFPLCFPMEADKELNSQVNMLTVSPGWSEGLLLRTVCIVDTCT